MRCAHWSSAIITMHQPGVASVDSSSSSTEEFEILERGEIRYFIRPRVGLHCARTFDEVQRLVLIMCPTEGQAREIHIGKKRMPNQHRRERAWGYVARVGEYGDIERTLRASHDYETKTRGMRHQHGAIRVATGEYGIALHRGRDHVHLLTHDTDCVETLSSALLDALCIQRRASYIAAVFNPEKRSLFSETNEPEDDEGVPFHEPSILDDAELDRFEGRRFVPLSPSLVGFEGTEIVLIGDPKHKCNAFW